MALDFKLIANPKVADDGLPVTADNRYALSGTAGGGLLAVVQDTTLEVVTLNNNVRLTALNSTRLTLTFTAPSSGKVLVKMSGAFYSGAVDGTNAYLGILTHGTTTQVGSLMLINGGPVPDTWGGAVTVSQLITGLTPASSYSWDAGGVAQNGTSQFRIDTGDLGTTGSLFIFEVWSAP